MYSAGRKCSLIWTEEVGPKNKTVWRQILVQTLACIWKPEASCEHKLRTVYTVKCLLCLCLLMIKIRIHGILNGTQNGALDWKAEATFKPFPTSNNPQCTPQRFFIQPNKSPLHWSQRVSQELMRSGAAWMWPCPLHSCTEPMVTTRFPSACCSPHGQLHRPYWQWNMTRNFPFHILLVVFQKEKNNNKSMDNIAQHLSLTSISTSLPWLRNFVVGKH